MKTEKILESVKELAKDTTGLLGFGYMDLTTGESCMLEADTPIPTASVFKIFVLTELYRQIQEGVLTESYRLKVEKASQGSGILSKFKHEVSLSVHDHAVLMMTLSDNTSSDLLFDLVGKNNIRKNIIERLGLSNTRIDQNCTELLRAAYAEKAWNGAYFRCPEGEHDCSTPRDMLRLLKALHDGELLDHGHNEAVLELMKPSPNNMRIERYLPPKTRVARKTGSVDRLANDAGIVYTPKGDYAIVVFYNGNLASREEYDRESFKRIMADELIARISQAVYQIHTQ